jgi:hypothetical protein
MRLRRWQNRVSLPSNSPWWLRGFILKLPPTFFQSFENIAQIRTPLRKSLMLCAMRRTTIYNSNEILASLLTLAVRKDLPPACNGVALLTLTARLATLVMNTKQLQVPLSTQISHSGSLLAELNIDFPPYRQTVGKLRIA